MPFYKLDMTVPLSPELVTRRLQDDLVERRNISLFWDSWFEREDNEFFSGRVKENRFFINYIRLGQRNMFHPDIRGRITAPSGKGTHIEVVMYMNPLGAAFLTFWFCSGISLLYTGGIYPLKTFAAGVLIIIVGFLIAVSWFFEDAAKAKKMLILLWTEEQTKILVNTGSITNQIRCENCGHLNAPICSKCLYCGADIVSV